MIRITIACPVAYLADAAQFARATGYGPEDEPTFAIAPEYQDDAGNRYRVASGVVALRYVTDAVSPLREPEWGADMEAAARAQSLIRLHQEGSKVTATPDHIAAVIHDDPEAALAMLSVVRVEALE